MENQIIPIHLDDAELEYELLIRDSFLTDDNSRARTGKLDLLLKNERKGISAAPGANCSPYAPGCRYQGL